MLEEKKTPEIYSQLFGSSVFSIGFGIMGLLAPPLSNPWGFAKKIFFALRAKSFINRHLYLNSGCESFFTNNTIIINACAHVRLPTSSMFSEIRITRSRIWFALLRMSARFPLLRQRRRHASFATARISFRRRMHLKLFFVSTVRSLIELLLWFESCLSLRRIRQSLSGDTRRWKESRATNVHVWKMSNLNACWYWASICQSWLILISSQLSKACDRKKSKSVKFSREVSLICVSFFNFFSSKNDFFSR